MGNCVSAQDREAQLRSQEIDKQIEEDSRKLKKECKILLLGSGESGKSTIVKQMKIIHQNGYTREELASYRLTVYRNLLESAQAIVLAMRKLAIDPVLPANRAHADMILAYKVDPPSSIAAASSSGGAGSSAAAANFEFSEEVAAASFCGSDQSASSADGRSVTEKHRSPREALETVRERIEGEAVISAWSSLDTKTGVLTVHMNEKCFEAEIYADEAGYGHERQFNEEARRECSLGCNRWNALCSLTL